MMNPTTLTPGAEQYEYYFSPILRRMLVQYDYRNHDGILFSTVAEDLKTCRVRKENWLRDIEISKRG